ncbi:MAG: hypothetical protein Q9227_004292 [Pyrenula ochraceoflavens]
MSSSTMDRGVVDGQLPQYHFERNQGYVAAEADQDVGGGVAPNTSREQHLADDSYSGTGSDANDFSDLDEDEFNSGDRTDFTKAYNRQKRLNAAISDPNASRSSYPKSNPQKPTANTFAFIDDNDTSLSKHAANLRLDAAQSGLSKRRPQGLAKSDRATLANVLDRRTLAILRKLVNRNVVSKIHGVVSTGKEANVFYAESTPEESTAVSSRAIKIYKTSILAFKDRDKYVSGEHRYQRGYDKTSNRAIVEEWALKEFRNLKRIHAASIPCPEPIDVRQNVLVMEFLGESESVSALRLKDVEFLQEDSEERWSQIYVTILSYMRKLYQVCKLVHADLSEYNILFYQEKPWIIDVSQSVEDNHLRSSEFLRKDIKNVNDFFKRKGVRPLGEEKSFDYIRRIVKDDRFDMEAMRSEIQSEKEQHMQEKPEDTTEVNIEVFRQKYIPRTLEEVQNVEESVERFREEAGERPAFEQLLAEEKDTYDEEENQHDDSESQSGSDIADKTPRGKRFQDKDAKKEHKQKVKEEKREQRAKKIPKHEKKKLIKQTTRHKK